MESPATLNQCNLVGDVAVCAGDEIRNIECGSHTLDHPTWVWHDRIAYFLLQPTQVRLNNTVRQGSWREISVRHSDAPVSQNVFTLWIDHGKRPQHATYAYCVAPETAMPVGTDLASPPVIILANSPTVQAVWHQTLRIAAFAFYKPGNVEIRQNLTLAVDQPCLVLLREMSDKMMISMANPENQKATVTLDVDTQDDGQEPSSRSRIVFELPDGHHAGPSVTRAVPTTPKENAP